MTIYKIINVDDGPDDGDFINESFWATSFTNHLLLSSAQQVFTYLQSIKLEEDLPGLIITNLNMPGINGFGLLKAPGGMQRYRHIPVVVCSTTDLKTHVKMCLVLGATAFVTKLQHASGYNKLVAKWCQAVQN